MATQLRLIDEDADGTTPYDASRFLLDARTRSVGLAGVAKARAALATWAPATRLDSAA